MNQVSTVIETYYMYIQNVHVGILPPVCFFFFSSMLSSDAALQFTSSSSPQRFQSHRIPCRGQPFRSHRVTAMLFNHFVLIAELLSSGDSASDHLDSRLPHHQAARLLYCWAIKWSHMDDDDWEVTPVSGTHPFFATIMSRSQVQKLFQLVCM
jgi:hypothetical protein